jgi:hypothetical protein
MRRWISHLFIAAYLSALVGGISCQALKFGVSAHPAMYFVVWDMFCGWAAHETRYHLIAEGESGTYYWLAPNPWGTFKPYGDLARNHYDYYGHGLLRMAQNSIKHTQHEPLRRIISIEESWPKKYNLPDHLWALRTGEPKDPMSYFWVRNIYSPEGEPWYGRPDFLQQLYTDTIFSNPRLHADSIRNKPMFVINPYDRRLQSGNALGEAYSPTSVDSLPNAN